MTKRDRAGVEASSFEQDETLVAERTYECRVVLF